MNSVCLVTTNLEESLRLEHSAASEDSAATAERCFRISAAFSMGSSKEAKTREDKSCHGNEEKLPTNHWLSLVQKLRRQSNLVGLGDCLKAKQSI